MVPQTIPNGDRLANRLMRHYGTLPRGRNVYLLTDGSVTETQPSTSSTIQRVYMGGHVEQVTEAEKLALEGAGYTVDVDEIAATWSHTGTQFEYPKYTGAPPVEVITEA